MRRPGRILVVDDQERWRNALSEVLRAHHFHVDTAATPQEALARLSESFYHLLVLDIRMQDRDPTNSEGMQILRYLKQHELTDAVKVIMLSAYGTPQQMRSAYFEYGVVDFLDKEDFDNLEFRQKIVDLFAADLKTNLDLEIIWQQAHAPERVVVNINMDGVWIKQNTPLQSRVAQELEDLLCRLFWRAHSVLVRALSPGQSGAGVLWVQPFFTDGGGGRAVVVKFGHFRKIEAEQHNFETYVQPFVGGGRNTTVQGWRRTPQLGGIVYSLLGVTNDQVEDFGKFYRRSSVAQLRAVLDRLFQDTCKSWYANPGQLKPHDLTADYQELLNFTWPKLEESLAALKTVHGNRKLYFKQLGDERAFTNPVLTSADHRLVRTTYVGTMHGDFNEHNIFVDQLGYVWLIDFLRTGRGHILRDITQLDSVVRFQLLAPEDATLEERLLLEQALMKVEQFSQFDQLPPLETDNPALAKAYAIVVHLRTLARQLILYNPTDDTNDYFIALLYYALNLLRFYSVPTLQREHALLSASLLAERVFM